MFQALFLVLRIHQWTKHRSRLLGYYILAGGGGGQLIMNLISRVYNVVESGGAMEKESKAG